MQGIFRIFLWMLAKDKLYRNITTYQMTSLISQLNENENHTVKAAKYLPNTKSF